MDDIKKIIKEENYPDVLLLFGEEEFLLNEASSMLYQQLLKIDPSKSDIEIINGEEVNIDSIVSSAMTFPFISPKRVVIVNNFHKLFSGRISKKVMENSPLTKYLENPQDTTFLILKSQDAKLNGYTKSLSSRAKTKKKLTFPYNLLIEKFPWIEFPKVWDNQIPAWIVNRMSSFGKTIDPHSAQVFALHCNSSLREIASEIDKLLIFAKDSDEITIDIINQAIGINREFNVFELQKAVGRKDINKAIYILQNMLKSDRTEMLILTVLNNYFTALFKLIELKGAAQNQYQLAGKLGVSPAFVNDYVASMNYYSVYDVESSFNHLLAAEYQLKTSSTDSVLVLETMLFKIMSK